MTIKPLTQSVIRKVQMAKLLYDLGADCFRIRENPEKVGAGIILLQDSVELFLIAVCEHLEVPLDVNISFDKYFVKLKDKTNDEVPLKGEMVKLNRQRVNVKHHGILPNIEDCKNFGTNVKTFFGELATRYLNTDIDSITLIDLLNDDKRKELLKQAETCLKSGNYSECQINCRKALYLTFEERFDVRAFEKGVETADFLKVAFCEAPEYAKDEEYIRKHVMEPTDYIIIDYDKLERDLLSSGIPPADFWNVRRYTPEMYYYEDKGKWVIKEEFVEDLYNEEKAEYCFRNTVEILLLKQRHKESEKYITRKVKPIKLKKKKLKIYEKASCKSRVTFELECAPAEVLCFVRVGGLDDDKYYYHILRKREKDKDKDKKTPFLYGWISEDDVEEE